MTRRIARFVPIAAVVVSTGTLAAQYPTVAPAGGAIAPVRALRAVESLGNGLDVEVLENREVPLITVYLGWPRGTAHDPPGMEGLADLIARVSIRGTRAHGAEEISARFAALGGTVRAEAWMDYSTISVTVFSDHVDDAIQLLGDMLTDAAFADDQIEQARDLLLEAVEAAVARPPAMGERFLARALFSDHPYGRRATPTSVRDISVDVVRQHARSWIDPQGAVLVLAGDIGIDRATELAERHLSRWTSPPASTDQETTVEAPPPLREPRVLLVHQRGTPQARVVLGTHMPRTSQDAHRAARAVIDRLLGASDGRLVKSLRNENRWTYGATTGISPFRQSGMFSMGTDVRAEIVTDVLTELARQLDVLRTEPAAEGEVRGAARFLAGAFPRDVETPEQLARRAVEARYLGLEPDHLARYHERLIDVHPDQVLAVAKEVFTPEAIAIVVVGDGEQLYDKIMPFGNVSIVDTDGAPLAVDDLSPRPAPLVLDGDQLAARRDSFVAIVQGNALGTMVTELTRTGDSIVYNERTSIPMANWQLETTVRIDPATLELRGIAQTGHMSGQSVDLRVEWRDGRAIGRATSPQPGGTPRTLELDTAVVAGTIEVNALTALVPALDLEGNAVYSVYALNAATGAIDTVRVTVTATGNLGVPAGLFSVYRVEVSGGPAPLALYVTRETPRRIVKIERLGQPFSFELVK